TGSRPLAERLRGVSRVGLAGMMIAAVALLVVARFLGGGSLGPAVTATPTSSPVANASPTLSPVPTATASPLPTPTPSPGPTATPVPSSTPAFSQTYTVKSGDTLGNIASRFGTTVAKLKALNNISNSDLIYIGEVLKIP
ncbi:MAG: LysM peptidoglycan-binding domain-containing protein, partial [Candidatus Limnocylindrales bacterium]